MADQLPWLIHQSPDRRQRLQARFLRQLWGVIMFSTIAVVMGGESGGATEQHYSGRSVTVADCIGMNKLGDPSYWMGGSSLGHVAQFSPDGTKFVVVLRKGDIRSNTNEYSMLLWNTDEVFKSLAPRVLLRMSSSSNRPAISEVAWLEDNKSLMFLGEKPGESQQLYRFNTRTHSLKRLTNHPTGIGSYSATALGDKVAYIAPKPAESIWDEKSRREGLTVSSQLIWSLIAGQKRDAEGYYAERELLFQSDDKVVGPLDAKGTIDLYHSRPLLSPDGKYILIPTRVAEIPEEWNQYSDLEIRRLIRQRLPQGSSSYLTRYILIDTSTNTSRVLLDSPLDWHQSTALWLPDSRSVVISGVYLPLAHTNDIEREERKSRTFTVEVDIQSGALSRVNQENVSLLRWDGKQNGLILETRVPAAVAHPILFRKIGGRWERVLGYVPTNEDVKVEITLDEDMTARPRIFATELSTGRRTMLLDLNPEFDHLKFANVQEIAWKGSDGHVTKGGLYYPVDYSPGERYPLVIQTHGWDSKKFWIDGPWTSAFSAQPLAGDGIAVLQVPDPGEDLEQTPEEPVRAVSAYEGAIDYLDSVGLIDRGRVGIIGFSRTGLYVRSALTHSKYHFAAASVMDTTDGGYFQYLAFFNIAPGWSEGYETLNGGLPFGKGLLAWMEHSPGFSMEKVDTPLRIVVPRSANSVLEWEWFAGLSRLAKPVEMTIMEDGEHVLQKPWERIISQQGNVDWFRFWLQGYEDQDPAKAEQYKRWEALRLQRDTARPVPASREP